MAHFAEINEDNIVVRILVTNNEMSNEGKDWLEENLAGTWVKTSYNTHGGTHDLDATPLRKNFASIGGSYNQRLDAFIGVKPYSSWLLNEYTCLWEAPIAYPENGENYDWDEQTLTWILSS